MRRIDFGNYWEKKVFVKVCRAREIACDNAQAESFFSRFKSELIEGGVFEDIEQARTEIFSYIEGVRPESRLTECSIWPFK